MKPRICPVDGLEQPDDAKFCIFCGSPLPDSEALDTSRQPLYCPNDGVLQPENAKFCISCGIPLSQLREPEYFAKSLVCPKDGMAQPENAKFCIYCGTPLVNEVDLESTDPKASGLVKSIPAKNFDTEYSSNIAVCYKCKSQDIIGICTKDKHPFCSRHGFNRFEWGYCKDCVNHAHMETPWTIKLISWIYYLIAIGLIIFTIGAGLYFYMGINEVFQIVSRYGGTLVDPTQSFFEIGPELFLPFIGIIIASIILIAIGKRFPQASLFSIGITVLGSLLILPYGLITLFILFLNSHWIIMKRSPNI